MLQSVPPGAEIEINTESAILLNYIKSTWPTVELEEYPGLPIKTKIDWQADPNRIIEPVAIRTYTVISNIREKDIGANILEYDCPVGVDIFVRDLDATSQRIEPTQLTAIESYLRDLISTNRLALRNKGIHSMGLEDIIHAYESPTNEEDPVWWHSVVQVRMCYYMNRLPDS